MVKNSCLTSPHVTVFFFREMATSVFLHQPRMHNGMVQYWERRKTAKNWTLKCIKAGDWSFDKMYIYAHPLAGLNLTLTMHINSGFLSFSVIDTIENNIWPVMVSSQSQPTYWKVRTKILKNSFILTSLTCGTSKYSKDIWDGKPKEVPYCTCWLNSLNNVICYEIGRITLFVIKNDKNRWAWFIINAWII